MPSSPNTPSSRPPLPAAALLVAALLAAAIGSFSTPANAAPATARRLTLQIDGLRQGATQLGADRGRERLAQQFTLSVVLQSDGTPMPNNPLDPEDGRRQLERAQSAQQRIQSAQAAVAARTGRSVAPAAASMADIQQMQARAQQLQARCGTDSDCLMREASALSVANMAAMGADRGTQARMQAYGMAAQTCMRSAPAGAARDACMADARRRAGGGVEDESGNDDAVATPYLHFIGRAACKIDFAVKIDGRIEGSFQDVQGTVPFTQTVQAEGRQRDDAVCPLVQAVLDTRSGRLWTHTPMALPALPGVTVRSEKGRAPQRSEGQVDLQWREANDWLVQKLSNLSAAGEDQVRLPAGGGQNEVRVRWRFEPI